MVARPLSPRAVGRWNCISSAGRCGTSKRLYSRCGPVFPLLALRAPMGARSASKGNTRPHREYSRLLVPQRPADEMQFQRPTARGERGRATIVGAIACQSKGVCSFIYTDTPLFL